MTPTVAVVTDSAASLPAELARKWAVRVVPLQVIVDGVSHTEGAGISPDEVLGNLLAGLPVTTSQPGPMAFVNAFREAEQAGASAIVAVMISGKLSGTASAASA